MVPVSAFIKICLKLNNNNRHISLREEAKEVGSEEENYIEVASEEENLEVASEEENLEEDLIEEENLEVASEEAEAAVATVREADAPARPAVIHKIPLNKNKKPMMAAWNSMMAMF
jgi:hypothetical protein